MKSAQKKRGGRAGDKDMDPDGTKENLLSGKTGRTINQAKGRDKKKQSGKLVSLFCCAPSGETRLRSSSLYLGL